MELAACLHILRNCSVVVWLALGRLLWGMGYIDPVGIYFWGRRKLEGLSARADMAGREGFPSRLILLLWR